MFWWQHSYSLSGSALRHKKKGWVYTYYYCFSTEGDRKEMEKPEEEAGHGEVRYNQKYYIEEGLGKKVTQG